MIQAQPKTPELLEQMNLLRTVGRVLPIDFEVMKLKREIDNLKKSDELGYHQLMSAYYALVGNHDEMSRFCRLCVNKYQDEESILFAVASYCTAGFFNEAVNAFNRLDFATPSEIDSKAGLAETMFQVRIFEQFTKTLAMANLLTEEIKKDFSVIQLCAEILERKNISQDSVNSMLDLAWKVMREHRLLVVRSLSVLPDLATDTLTILIPVDIPAASVAKMDWEFTERLFSELPDAPTQSVFVGFMTNDPVR